jgi:hypothetical protein
MSLPFLTAVRRMQTRDPAVKVLFALWSLAMVVTVIATAAAAACVANGPPGQET